MKQADLGLNLTTKRTRKREFPAEMERVVPWAALLDLITPYAPEGKRGRPPFAVETMLRIHIMQQWFTLSDPAMEEALHDVPLYREFSGLTWQERLPDETTILRFRRLLEEHKLAPQILVLINELLGAKGLLLRAGTVVDATTIAVSVLRAGSTALRADAGRAKVSTWAHSRTGGAQPGAALSSAASMRGKAPPLLCGPGVARAGGRRPTPPWLCAGRNACGPAVRHGPHRGCRPQPSCP